MLCSVSALAAAAPNDEGRAGAKAAPPLATTYRRRLSPKTADKAVGLSLGLSSASFLPWAFHLRPWERQAAAAWALPWKAGP